jgi:2-methylcitrate dehydratase PrpD
MAKAAMGAFGARNGTTAAMLAKGGYHGPPDVFEGRDGLLRAFSPEPRPEELTGELGQRFEVVRTSIKKHACGGPIQASVDGLLVLIDEHGLQAGDIDSIEVRIAESGRVIVDGRDDPPINLQYVLAVAAIDRVVGVTQTHAPERLNSPEVRSLRERIFVSGDDNFERLWPSRRPAHVTIVTVDGRRLSRLVEHAEGSPDNPMTWEGVASKFENLCAGWDAADAVLVRVAALEDLEDVRDLLSTSVQGA